MLRFGVLLEDAVGLNGPAKRRGDGVGTSLQDRSNVNQRERGAFYFSDEHVAPTQNPSISTQRPRARQNKTDARFQTRMR